MHRLIDTHAHLDEVADLDAALDRARSEGVAAIIAVGIDYESNNRVMEIAGKYESIVFPALGIHPQNLGESGSQMERNLKFIEDNADRAVAIGEIGLDYHKKVRKRASKDVQQQVLREVLGLAKRFDKPVSLHSRYSWRDCFEIVRDSGVTKAVFHWYSGPLSVLHEFVDAGFFASATPAVQYGAEHSEAIKAVPLNQLMLETDSPVVYSRGSEHEHAAEPADVSLRVLDEVARLRASEPEAIARATTENAIRFFGLSNWGVQ